MASASIGRGQRKCATCHTNIPFMLARPKIAGGDPAPMKEVRMFLEAVRRSPGRSRSRAPTTMSLRRLLP